MQYFSVKSYNNLLDRVIEWNTVVGNTDKELQREVTLEEIDETIKAIYEGDKRETLDGISDVFVTAGYLNYLHTQDYVNEFVTEEGVNPLKRLESLRGCVKTRNVPSHIDIQKLIYWASKEYSEEEMHNYLVKVLTSNESKFVPDSEWNKVREIDEANAKYASKGFKNIVGVQRTFLGQPVWLLRADRGQGKVLKPLGFKEP